MSTATLVFTVHHLYAIAAALDFALAHEPDAEADDALTMVREAIADIESP